MSPYAIILTTCPTETEAQRAIAALFDQRLAACIQTNPTTSTYRWQGKIETAHELRLLIKARAADYAAIEAVLKSISSYDNPEIIAIPITQGSPLYLDWIAAETQRG